jgi:hypothetical protein
MSHLGQCNALSEPHANIYTSATNIPTSSASGSASATASGKATASGSMIVMPSGNSTSPSMTGSPIKPTGTGAAGASGTKTGSTAESTGAAGKLEIGIAAALVGLFAVAL